MLCVRNAYQVKGRTCHLQITRLDAPDLEHERDRVVEQVAQQERAHERDGARAGAEPLRRDFGALQPHVCAPCDMSGSPRQSVKSRAG